MKKPRAKVEERGLVASAMIRQGLDPDKIKLYNNEINSDKRFEEDMKQQSGLVKWLDIEYAPKDSDDPYCKSCAKDCATSGFEKAIEEVGKRRFLTGEEVFIFLQQFAGVEL